MSGIVTGAPEDVQEAWRRLPKELKTLINLWYKVAHDAYNIPLNYEMMYATNDVRVNSATCIKYLTLKKLEATPAIKFIVKEGDYV